MFKRIIKTLIWVLIGLYFSVVILLHIPFIQNFIGGCASSVLSKKFGTKVSVGRVDLGFINRLIIDDSEMLDQSGKRMLKVARISVKINPLALANGQIEITSAQFFGLHANLYKQTPEAKPNFQFVVDSLASKDTTKQQSPINLQINSLIIRNSDVCYRLLSKASRPSLFSPNDIKVGDISAHFIVNRITNDSLNVKVKRLSFRERCGFEMKKLSLNAVVSRKGAKIEKLYIQLPSSLIESELIQASYTMSDGKSDIRNLHFNGKFKAPKLMPNDFACFATKLSNLNIPLGLSIDFNGTGSSVSVNDLSIHTSNKHLIVGLSAYADKRNGLTWRANLKKFIAQQDVITSIYNAMTGKEVPSVITRLGDVKLTATASGCKKDVALKSTLESGVGHVKIAAEKQGKGIEAHLATTDFALGKLLDVNNIGNVSALIDAKGTSKDDFIANAKIANFAYNDYTYRDICIKAQCANNLLNTIASIDDPNAQVAINAKLNRRSRLSHLDMTANIKALSPNALNLTKKWHATTFAGNIHCDISGSNINDADGKLSISNFTMTEPDNVYAINNIDATTGFNDGNHFLNLRSDFGSVDINGHFNYNTVASSVLNLIADKLPTIPGLEKKPLTDYNDFTINASIHDTQWMEKLLGVPLTLHSQLNISGDIDDRHKYINLWCDVPSFSFKGTRFADTSVNIESPGDTLKADIRLKKLNGKGNALALSLAAKAHDNHLSTSLSFNNNSRQPLKGTINARTMFAKDDNGISTAYIDVLESEATVGDTAWHVSPSHITYRKNHLDVDNFAINHGGQSISINGIATPSTADSLFVTLNDIDVSYVLNLVDFHSVDFFGLASGNAHVAGIFGQRPQIAADLRVRDFKFETGRMGTLFANVAYDSEEGRINIDAIANDEDNRRTFINGYVSPRHNYINLGIKARNTRAEFMGGFCDSFMDNIDASINGDVNVVGPLSNINLVGSAKVDGSVRLTALNTTYWLRGDSVIFVPDEIKFKADTLYDRNNNIGILNGSLRHQHLTRMTYDLNVRARNLLAYDTHSFDGNSFYGTAYTTGTCRIQGKSGEVNIDIDATPERGSILVYNAADRNSLSSQDYIQWKSHSAKDSTQIENIAKTIQPINIGTNIKLNFLVNCNPNATLKILMDEKTGDYISLNGEGVLRATYFNKGTFDLYGNYVVDNGVYKLTIQNIIKKDFEFQRGSTLSFGGDPYHAVLDLKALYVLNSVSLSDLNIGNSFANNNVRVNCLMNITGTPEAPKVSFSLDMPTLSNDAKQMVYSLLNAEEETNQQVLYLLAVGRFYAQGENTQSPTQQYSQTSLAMQSFLSGTISQQINSLLSNVINSRNWNFGANISTGTDGFYNAEYEGILSGRLLNNRLLFNGQFGYRDNPNTTNNFIGDFDLKYLLLPNGNLAINVYNRTNDRYFTRNSLNTQGLGLLMKTDFTRISDLFFWRKKDKTKENEVNNKK